MKRLMLFVFFIIILISPRASLAKVPPALDHIGHDISYTFGSWPMLLILGGGIAAGESSYLDHDVADHLRNNPLLGNKFDKVADIAGSPYVIDAASALTYGIGYICKNETMKLTGEVLVEALFLTEASTMAMKGAIRRGRPDGGNYSFPSGHAARTFAVASALETLHGPVVGIPAFFFAGMISFSRIDYSSHYLSDVIFGAIWGSAIGWGTARFHNRPDKNKFAIAPIVGEYSGIEFIYQF